MNATFFIKGSVEHKISVFYLILFLLMLPFDRFYCTIVLISYLVHSTIFLRSEQLKTPGWEIFVLQSVFYVSLFAAIYTSSVDNAFRLIGRQLAIAIFPLIFYYSSLDFRQYRHMLLSILCISCAFTIAYLYLDALMVITHFGLPVRALFSWEFVNQNFTMPIQMHATYFSMLVVMSLLFCIDQIISQGRQLRIFYGCLFLVLVTGMFQLGSKSCIISFFLIMLFWALLIKRRSKMKSYILGLTIVISTVMVWLVMSFSIFHSRYIQFLKWDIVENKNVPDASSRIDRWHVCYDLIRRQPIFGSGTGTEEKLLKEEYYERKMYSSFLASLNAHNQYLSFLINSGLVGLLIYLFTLGWGAYQAILNRDIYLLSFIVLIAVVSFAEDILDLNKGIFIYAFFFSFLYYSNGHKLKERPVFVATQSS